MLLEDLDHGPVATGPLEQRRRVREIVGAEHDVDVRSPFDDRGAVLLGQAPADRDLHVGATGLERLEAAGRIAVRADVRQSDLLEGDRREVERRRPAGFLLAVDVIDVVAVSVRDPPPCLLQHLLAVAEVQGVRRARLHASRHGNLVEVALLVEGSQRLPVQLQRRDGVQPVHAERALADLRGELVPLGGDRPERTGPHAVPAADADLRMVDDGALDVLLERRHRAGGDAGGLVAMHALALGEDVPEPGRRLRVVDLVVRDQHVGVGIEGGRVLEGAEDAARLQHRLHAGKLVPLLAAHLAGLAPDALGGVDQLGVAHRRPPERGARDDTASSAVAASAGTTFTRQALVSCVPAPGSPASMVSTLTLGPFESPLKPQL